MATQKRISIQTERLLIFPLTPKQIKLLSNNITALEDMLQVKYDGTPIEGKFKRIIEAQSEITNDDSKNYLWHTFWLIVKDGVIIGEFDFKDVPDKDGRVEIGYGMGSKYQNQGFMTETVYAMCKWAKQQKGVKTVIAETGKSNIYSQKLLQKIGFTYVNSDKTIWWKL